MNRLALSIMAVTMTSAVAVAQTMTTTSTVTTTTTTTVQTAQPEVSRLIKHMDIGVTLGTTGFGVDAAMTLSNVVRVRAGVSYTPPVHVGLTFPLSNYSDGAINESNFARAQELMNNLTGFNIDDRVDFDCRPTMFNFKLLADIYPFRNNKHWHFTAGFYIGNKTVGTARNTMEEMPSLLAVAMYNRLYESTQSPDFIDNVIDKPIIGSIYLDPEQAMVLQDKMAAMGSMGIHIGDRKDDGQPYLMKTDKDGTVSARARAALFRPYVGFGYGGALSRDKRWNISFDCGAMFWGGSPDVITHDGTNLTTEITNIRGRVGEYMDVVSALKVYPVLNLRISYAIF